jgi:FixJ family two-component response regulator
MLKQQKIVAIVDDDPSMLRATKDLLNALGFLTTAFTSAQDFLDDREAAQANCLLLDIDLGGMSGFELQHQLKISGSTLPIIFITALDDDGTREQAKKAGCIAFLRKPYSARQLIDALQKALP